MQIFTLFFSLLRMYAAIAVLDQAGLLCGNIHINFNARLMQIRTSPLSPHLPAAHTGGTEL